MRYPNLLIFKRWTIDTVTTITISLVGVTTLNKLIVDKLMEEIASKAAESTCILYFTCAEASEVFSSPWNLLFEQFKNDSTSLFIILTTIVLSHTYVHEALRILWIKIGNFMKIGEWSGILLLFKDTIWV